MEKKVIIAAVIIIALFVLLVPRPSYLDDGGTVEYKALLYKISNVHTLISIDEMKKAGKVKPYDEGIVIEVLGFEIYNSVK